MLHFMALGIFLVCVSCTHVGCIVKGKPDIRPASTAAAAEGLNTAYTAALGGVQLC